MVENVAVITMVYNENDFLPRWVRYYAEQFGAKNCYVVDHGSDDGSTDKLDVNVVRIPRSPMHDKKRAKFISLFASSLSFWYDCVIYCDVDEFLVVDPNTNKTLRQYCLDMPTNTLNAIGIDVIQTPEDVAPVDNVRPILQQRHWGRFIYAMCKPLITKVPLIWTPGFHASTQPIAFGDVYLFHMHYADHVMSLRRLQKTRVMPWGDGPEDHYQRWSDERHLQMARELACLPRIEDESSFRSDGPILKRYTDLAIAFCRDNPDRKDNFQSEIGVSVEEIMKIPERFSSFC